MWRNLGLAYVNARGDLAAGQAAYEHAFALGPGDARVLFERDQLRRRQGTPPAELASARYYNDQPPELIYYQGLAQRARARGRGAGDLPAPR